MNVEAIIDMENETMIHPETGELLRRDVRLIEFKFKGEPFTVNMPGWYPAEGDDGIFSHEDMKIAGQVLRTLKARHAESLAKNNFNINNPVLT